MFDRLLGRPSAPNERFRRAVLGSVKEDTTLRRWERDYAFLEAAFVAPTSGGEFLCPTMPDGERILMLFVDHLDLHGWAPEADGVRSGPTSEFVRFALDRGFDTVSVSLGKDIFFEIERFVMPWSAQGLMPRFGSPPSAPPAGVADRLRPEFERRPEIRAAYWTLAALPTRDPTFAGVVAIEPAGPLGQEERDGMRIALEGVLLYRDGQPTVPIVVLEPRKFDDPATNVELFRRPV